MRRHARLLFCLALWIPPAAAAQPQFLFAARAGASNPHEPAFDWGISAGAQVAWSMHRLAALELVVDHSLHGIQQADEGAEAIYGSVTAADLGFQYRVDVTPRFVPYVGLGIEARWVRRPGFSTENRYGGAFAIGLLAPFTERWFAGIEARYGISTAGQIPVRQVYSATIGYATAMF